MNSVTIINRNALHGRANGLESLDLCLAAASFGQEVKLVFLDDGVFQLLSGQQADVIEHRNYSKTFAALEFYDVEEVYVCEKSLNSRGLSKEQLCIDVELLSSAQLRDFINGQQTVLTF